MLVADARKPELGPDLQMRSRIAVVKSLRSGRGFEFYFPRSCPLPWGDLLNLLHPVSQLTWKRGTVGLDRVIVGIQ